MQSSPQVASSSVWISGPLYIIMSYPCQSGLHVMSSFDLRGADLCDERLQEWHSIPTNKNVLLPHRSWYTVDEFMLVQFSWNSRLLSRAEGRKEEIIYIPQGPSPKPPESRLGSVTLCKGGCEMKPCGWLSTNNNRNYSSSHLAHPWFKCVNPCGVVDGGVDYFFVIAI